jgi:murein DD-endopeptidase MepM/ murein hydrolase activator NlpD
MISLFLPLKNIYVVQPFGTNFVDFYQNLGLNGHNGIDFRSRSGCNCYASTSGEIVFAGEYGDGGIGIDIWDKKQGTRTIYYHLESVNIEKGQQVKAGDLIGKTDNTGKYTTGDHLHFGLKMVDERGFTINTDNGFRGAIDPTPYFEYNYKGDKIKNKDCYKSNAYHNYFRKERNLMNEIKLRASLTGYLKKIPTYDEVNAAVYGGWDKETIKNDSMYQIWAFCKKSEYLNKEFPFN